MRLLITGAGGLLAAAIAREFRAAADVHPLDRGALDISDEAAVAAVLASVRPDVIVNCAAWNDVDGAESQPEATLRANALGVLALARAARAVDATLVHYGSDFVFSGDTDRPWTEDDAPVPRGVYASSKLLGDWFALEAPRAYVLRVESLFGEPGARGGRRGSLATIVDGITAGRTVRLFTDRVVSPSYTADVARATKYLVERQAPCGLYHCVNSGQATWVEIAAEAARLLGRPLLMEGITLDSAGLVAPRPRYSALSNAKLAAAGAAMPDWREALSRYLSRS